MVLNGFGTVINSLGQRAKPYLPQICGTIKWRLNNKSAKIRQQVGGRSRLGVWVLLEGQALAVGRDGQSWCQCSCAPCLAAELPMCHSCMPRSPAAFPIISLSSPALFAGGGPHFPHRASDEEV